MDIQQINSAIMFGSLSNTELNSIIDAVKWARARITEQNKRNLSLGDVVTFRSSKTGGPVTGTVTKIAIKFVTVRTPQGLWKVPANMLTTVADCVPA
jgi:small-conductance mechanosensitive channel